MSVWRISREDTVAPADVAEAVVSGFTGPSSTQPSRASYRETGGRQPDPPESSSWSGTCLTNPDRPGAGS